MSEHNMATMDALHSLSDISESESFDSSEKYEPKLKKHKRKHLKLKKSNDRRKYDSVVVNNIDDTKVKKHLKKHDIRDDPYLEEKYVDPNENRHYRQKIRKHHKRSREELPEQSSSSSSSSNDNNSSEDSMSGSESRHRHRRHKQHRSSNSHRRHRHHGSRHSRSQRHHDKRRRRRRRSRSNDSCNGAEAGEAKSAGVLGEQQSGYQTTAVKREPLHFDHHSPNGLAFNMGVTQTGKWEDGEESHGSGGVKTLKINEEKVSIKQELPSESEEERIAINRERDRDHCRELDREDSRERLRDRGDSRERLRDRGDSRERLRDRGDSREKEREHYRERDRNNSRERRSENYLEHEKGENRDSSIEARRERSREEDRERGRERGKKRGREAERDLGKEEKKERDQGDYKERDREEDSGRGKQKPENGNRAHDKRGRDDRNRVKKHNREERREESEDDRDSDRENNRGQNRDRRNQDPKEQGRDNKRNHVRERGRDNRERSPEDRERGREDRERGREDRERGREKRDLPLSQPPPPRETEHQNRRGGAPAKNNTGATAVAREEWGKQVVKEEVKEEVPEEKQKPNLGLSGKLTEDANTFKGVVIKYSQPSEARKPKRRWRWYIFKGSEELPFLPLHRQSAYLIGRERKVVDIPTDHPSCSKQHAVLQYRLVTYTRDDNTRGRTVRPYIIDLESANGTYVNNRRITPRAYVELLEKDVVKFGYSSREYVLLHETSRDSDADTVDAGLDMSPVSTLLGIASGGTQR